MRQKLFNPASSSELFQYYGVYNKCLSMRGRRRQQQYVLVLQTFPYGLAFLQKFQGKRSLKQGSNVVSSTPPLRIMASVERFTSLHLTSHFINNDIPQFEYFECPTIM